VTPPPTELRVLAQLVGADLRLTGGGFQAVSERRPKVPVSSQVTGVTLRSSEVRQGDLFAALPGRSQHGASSIPEAVDWGATGVLTDPEGAAIADLLNLELPLPLLIIDNPRTVLGELSAEVYGHPSRRLAVLGITGTSGKTTTSYFLEAGLVGCGLLTGVIGTVETRIASEVLPSDFTTPEAPDLQMLLQLMLQRGVQAVAMEVSSHALALDRVAATKFAVAAFTNLSQDHLDFHSDIDDYFASKERLFDGRARYGVVNIDDEYGRRLKAAHPEIVTVSATRPDADWTVTDLDIGAAGITNFSVHTPEGLTVPVALELPGSFNVANALLALACIGTAGLDVRLAAPALTGVVVPGRMQSVDCGQPFLAVVDYAHKPGALTAVLDAIRPDVTGRVIVVLGAGGDRDHGKRPMMGRVAADRAEVVIITDDNPRSEDPAAIRAAILSGIEDRHDVVEIPDRRSAIRAAVAAAEAGDAVIVAGKGHEQGQHIGDRMLPFSDVDELTDALHDLLGGRS
jgi:UDP-N-acetylmuramoyl-L-alanyl-D-glutamate--2,6-diaminopimelate ligase